MERGERRREKRGKSGGYTAVDDCKRGSCTVGELTRAAVSKTREMRQREKREEPRISPFEKLASNFITSCFFSCT